MFVEGVLTVQEHAKVSPVVAAIGAGYPEGRLPPPPEMTKIQE